MARLQDYQTVTPSGSDKLLIVQSQGQGLSTLDNVVGVKMDKANPTGTGSLSLNRKANTTVGLYSTAEGNSCTASSNQAHAEGIQTTASADSSHAEGRFTEASGAYSHAEGNQAKAQANQAHAEGLATKATADSAHAEGNQTTASGSQAHAEGFITTASGDDSHAEGLGTIANHRAQHTFGEFNVADTSTADATARGNYIEIVGKGTADNARSNARTLDWSGNEVLAGGLKINGNQDVIPTGFAGTAVKISAWSNTTGSANISIQTSSGRQFVISISSTGVISGSVIDP